MSDLKLVAPPKVLISKDDQLNPRGVERAQWLIDLNLERANKFARVKFIPDKDWRYTQDQIGLAGATIEGVGRMGEMIGLSFEGWLAKYGEDHPQIASVRFQEKLRERGLLKAEFDLYDWRQTENFLEGTRHEAYRADPGHFLLAFRFPKPLQGFDWKQKEGLSWPEKQIKDDWYYGFLDEDERESFNKRWQEVSDQEKGLLRNTVIEWGQAYDETITTVWETMDDNRFSPKASLRRVNPIGSHEPLSYYYLWDVSEKSEAE